jgi:hypothetical protein
LLLVASAVAACSGPAYTYVTDDGGAHWTKTGKEPAPSSLAYWLDRDNGWTGTPGNEEFWVTHDRGATWELVTQ